MTPQPPPMRVVLAPPAVDGPHAHAPPPMAIFVYEWPVRVWHWVTTLCIGVLAVTGYFIAQPLHTLSGEASEHFFNGKVDPRWLEAAFPTELLARMKTGELVEIALGRPEPGRPRLSAMGSDGGGTWHRPRLQSDPCQHADPPSPRPPPAP